MKAPFLFILTATLALTPLIRAQDSRQADYYLNSPDKYEGKKITLSCSHVKRLPAPVESGKDANFWAYTASRNDYKFGFILVLVPDDAADSFSKKYGFGREYGAGYQVKTRPLSGIFTKGEKRFFLAYTPSS
jgi:hypothetical protein